MLQDSDALTLFSVVSTKNVEHIAKALVKIKPLMNEVLKHLQIVIADEEKVDEVTPSQPNQRLSLFQREDKVSRPVATGSHKERLFCSICSRKFSKQVYLNVHMRQHKAGMASGNYRKLTNQTNNPRATMKVATPTLTVYSYKELSSTAPPVHILGPDFVESRVMYSCVVCQRLLEDRERLQRHYLHHLGILQFSCKYCDIRFQHPDNCMNHELACGLNSVSPEDFYHTSPTQINGNPVASTHNDSTQRQHVTPPHNDSA